MHHGRFAPQNRLLRPAICTLPVQSEIQHESSVPKQESSIAPVKQESSKPEESKKEEAPKPVESPVAEESSEEETSEKESSEETEIVDPSLIRDVIKEAIDSYEAFIDEYCDFLESYDSSDLTMLGKYAEMLQKEVDMSKKFDALDDQELTEAEGLYYAEVSFRCSEKRLTTTNNTLYKTLQL